MCASDARARKHEARTEACGPGRIALRHVSAGYAPGPETRRAPLYTSPSLSWLPGRGVGPARLNPHGFLQRGPARPGVLPPALRSHRPCPLGFLLAAEAGAVPWRHGGTDALGGMVPSAAHAWTRRGDGENEVGGAMARSAPTWARGSSKGSLPPVHVHTMDEEATSILGFAGPGRAPCAHRPPSC